MKTGNPTKCVRWCWKSFCLVFFCQKHLVRDLVVLSALVFVLTAILTISWIPSGKAPEVVGVAAEIQEIPLSEEETIQKQEAEVAVIQSRIDFSNWTPYQNTWFGFSLRYPDSWSDPIAKKTTAGAAWEQKIEFRPKTTVEGNPFLGFDVVLYNLSRAKEISDTEEFPALKNAELAADSRCASIEGHLLETGDYPAEEIYVAIDDPCYNAALFFTNTRDSYIYNLVPKLKEGMGMAGDPAREIASHMPEFFAVAGTLELIDIKRPKPVPPKPKITAPYPVSYKKENGRLVCAKKNDRPSKSVKNKGRHLDMECCLDPDEYPNPHCYYDPAKYGKYL